MTRADFLAQYEHLIVATAEPHYNDTARNKANCKEWWTVFQNLNASLFCEAVDTFKRQNTQRRFPTLGDFLLYYNSARASQTSSGIDEDNPNIREIDRRIFRLPQEMRKRLIVTAETKVREEVKTYLKLHAAERPKLEHIGVHRLFDCLITSPYWIRGRVLFEVRQAFADERGLSMSGPLQQDEIPF